MSLNVWVCVVFLLSVINQVCRPYHCWFSLKQLTQRSRCKSVHYLMAKVKTSRAPDEQRQDWEPCNSSANCNGCAITDLERLSYFENVAGLGFISLLLLHAHKNTLRSHGTVFYERHEADKNSDNEFLRGIFYLACSLDQRRPLRGFRWMNCNHCGTSGGCGPGLREQKDHQLIL